jgi:hypothetical protein
MKRAACVLALVLAAPIASAQNAAEATRLFSEAQALAQSGDWEAACAKFEGSLKAGAGIGTMLYLGDCYEHVSRPSSAFAMYQGAATLAQTRQDAREATARELAEKIRPRVSWVVLHFHGTRPRGYEVRTDGTLIADADLDAKIPADPGPHMIEARAFDKVAWRGTFRISAEATTETVEVPELRAVAPVVVTRSSGNTQRIVGVVLGGLGLASIGVATGLGIYVIDQNNQTKDPSSPYFCDDVAQTCTPQGHDKRNNALSAAHAVDATLGIGIAALVGGVILYLTAPKNRDVHVGVGTLTFAF